MEGGAAPPGVGLGKSLEAKGGLGAFSEEGVLSIPASCGVSGGMCCERGEGMEGMESGPGKFGMSLLMPVGRSGKPVMEQRQQPL